MAWVQVLATALLTTALILGAVFWIGPQGHRWSAASAHEAHGWGSGFGNSGGACDVDPTAALGWLDAAMADKLGLAPDQRAKWQAVTAALGEEPDLIAALCASRPMAEIASPTDASFATRLTRLETGFESGLKLLAVAKPLLLDFHESLDATQRAQLDQLLAHRGRP